MSKVKSVLRYVLAVILVLAIIIFTIINIATSTILNKSFVLKKLEETSYYTKIYAYTKSNFENYIYQSGLDESVLDNILTEEQVKKDTEKIITNIYNNIEEDISTDELKERLKANIEEKNKGANLTVAQKQSIDSFVDQICKEYKGSIAHFEFEKKIYKVYSKVKKIADLGKKASLIAIGVSIIGLIIISLRRIYKAFTFSGIALLSSGLFFTFANMYINSKIKIQSLTILNDVFSFTLRDILETILNNVKTNGITFVGAGIALILIPNLIHNIIKNMDKSYKRRNNHKKDVRENALV